MPNTFLQAWARGVPSVAFIDTGARRQGEPVYCVARDLDEAVGEIARLCSDDTYRARASHRCREYFADTHSSAEVVARYASVFSDLLHGERRP